MQRGLTTGRGIVKQHGPRASHRRNMHAACGSHWQRTLTTPRGDAHGLSRKCGESCQSSLHLLNVDAPGGAGGTTCSAARLASARATDRCCGGAAPASSSRRRTFITDSRSFNILLTLDMSVTPISCGFGDPWWRTAHESSIDCPPTIRTIEAQSTYAVERLLYRLNCSNRDRRS